MASGYKKSTFALNLKVKESRHPLDKPQPVRVLVKNGVALSSVEILSNPAELSVANRLRREAPTSEWLVWPALQALGFEHSVPMCGFYLDFYHPALRMAVEIDGMSHKGRRWRDRNRDRVLRNVGVDVHRFYARMAYQEPDRLIGHVRSAMDLKTDKLP